MKDRLGPMAERNRGLYEEILFFYNMQEPSAQPIIEGPEADANLAIGLHADGRTYDYGAEILYTMDVKSIELITANPDKDAQLLEYGIDVKARVPLIVGQYAQNRSYLRTKASRIGHIYPSEEFA